MQDDHQDNMMQDHEEAPESDMGLSAAATTIDPSVVQSRIRQSASLQQEMKMQEDGQGDQPVFPKLNASQANGNKSEYRRVRCPPHRYTPLREHWEQILTPLVEYLKLQVRATNYYIIHEMSANIRVRGRSIPWRNVACVVPGSSNPPGSLNAIMNEVGRLNVVV